MLTQKLTLTFAGFAAVAMLAGTAQAAPVVFFGENLTPGASVSGTPTTARANFLAGLSGVGSQGFESFERGRVAPLQIDFPGSGGAITATLAGDGDIENTSGSGRFNTTASGGKWWEVANSFSITFSSAVSAFGFYGTDIGDFNGQITLALTDVNDVVTQLTVPNTKNGPNASLLFYGFIDAANSYKSIQFGNTASGTDFFGFDDMVIGDREQVVPNPDPVGIPEPATLALVGLSLLGLASTRRQS